MVVCFTHEAQEAQVHERLPRIPPGESEGNAGNRHKGADQWLLVVDGHGDAQVKNRRYKLVPRTLILIESGERHEIRNTGRTHAGARLP